jgi:hypothetical protein
MREYNDKERITTPANTGEESNINWEIVESKGIPI